MEHGVTVTVIAKATFLEEPKWSTMMAKNVHQVVSWAVETLANTPKQEERKFNLRLTSFEAKEGESEKELVQRFNVNVVGPNEIMCQGCRHHAVAACCCMSLRLGGGYAPKHNVI
jgi:hypothetical protein